MTIDSSDGMVGITDAECDSQYPIVFCPGSPYLDEIYASMKANRYLSAAIELAF